MMSNRLDSIFESIENSRQREALIAASQKRNEYK
jgi:hypothetical protein